MNDDQRALLIVAALWSGVVGSGGFAGGRMSVSVPPAEVRYYPFPVPVAPLAEAAPIEQPAPVTIEPASTPQVVDEPPAVIAPPVDVKPPLPTPRPKVDAKPKEQPKPQKARAVVPPKKSLPSCAVVKREYEAMTWAQKMAAYHSATPEQVAHGKRCLGF